jgi:hypothetical protein
MKRRGAGRIEIKGTRLAVFFGDPETICLYIEDSGDSEDGPCWNPRTRTLSMTHGEAVKLGNTLLAFAAALKAAMPEYFEEA